MKPFATNLSIVLAIAATTQIANASQSLALRNALIAGAMGAAIGTNQEHSRRSNTLILGSVGFGLGLLASMYYYNLDSNPDLKAENSSLKKKLDEFQKQLEPKLVGGGSGLLQSPLPKDVAQLVNPGEWKRYKMDQWVQDTNQPNIWYRQVEMFELIPPEAR